MRLSGLRKARQKRGGEHTPRVTRTPLAWLKRPGRYLTDPSDEACRHRHDAPASRGTGEVSLVGRKVLEWLNGWFVASSSRIDHGGVYRSLFVFKAAASMPEKKRRRKRVVCALGRHRKRRGGVSAVCSEIIAGVQYGVSVRWIQE